MRLRVADGPHDGALVILAPGKFYQEGLPDQLAEAVEGALRETQVFRVFSASPQGATDASESRQEPPLDTTEGITFAGRATVRRVIGATVNEEPV